jgi:hypothetical protein
MLAITLRCAHCMQDVQHSDAGVVRQWRMFILAKPHPVLLACSSVCEGEVRRMAYILAGESGERDDAKRPNRR